MGPRLSVLLHSDGPPSAKKANCNSRCHPLSSPSLLLQLPQSLPSPSPFIIVHSSEKPTRHLCWYHSPPLLTPPLYSALYHLHNFKVFSGLLWFLLITQRPHSKSSLEASQASRRLSPEELGDECAYSFFNSFFNPYNLHM